MSALRLLAEDGSDEILRELLVDRLAKIGIVIVGLLLLGVGMALIWRRVSRRG
ncbi:hypothetical protein AB0I55_31840 [Actinocatenispora sera]|uniref:hypothetical protein n=1 Tax=Actinocatenispora sera TaxID=390989 RepID=UPI00340D79F6